MKLEMYEELEAAAFLAVPVLEPEEMVHGWRLRFANGCTKRANSANCTLASGDLNSAQIIDIERRYQQRGLPPIFRLTSIAAPNDIDRTLEERGYHLIDHSWVMVLPTLNVASCGSSLYKMNADDWASAFVRISGGSVLKQDVHLQMLRLIQDPCAFAIEHISGDPICSGVGVVSGKWVGVFDIATATPYRQKGWATRLCGKLLAWGRGAGAESAYLQVTESNVGAIRIYEALGFQRAYHYWYRVAPPVLKESER